MNRTVAHSLGVVPSTIIVKPRNSPNSVDRSWTVYHTSLGATKYLLLDSTAAAGTLSTNWNNTEPTASVFSLGTENNVNNATGVVGEYVAYLFAEVPGYSKFGSYTGNASTDGPFVYTGFKPRWVMVKRTDSTGNWRLHDSARDAYNPGQVASAPNLTNADLTGSNEYVDLLSNGFKLRNADSEQNGSGATFIYAAFAEMPFKYATAGFSGANPAGFIAWEF